MQDYGVTVMEMFSSIDTITRPCRSIVKVMLMHTFTHPVTHCNEYETSTLTLLEGGRGNDRVALSNSLAKSIIAL